MTKFIGGLLMPVPIILVLLGFGLVFLFLRYRRFDVTLVIAGFGLLLALSLPALAERMLLSLESQHPAMSRHPAADWIVVLGGGVKLPLICQQ